MISLPHKRWYRYFPDGRLPEMLEWIEDTGEWSPSRQDCNCNKTTMTHDEMIAVIVADEAGKKIQGQHKGQPFVFDVKDHVFNFHHYNYWVACEPRHAWFKEVNYGGLPCVPVQWEQCSKGDPFAVEFKEVVR